MGQQQLLITVLVTILIGIATIVAINTLESARIQSNTEAMKVIMVEASGTAQGYYNKTQMMGGGSRTFNGIDLEYLGLASDSTYGSFYLDELSSQSFNIVGESLFDTPDIVLTVYPDDFEFQED